jgi:Domain of unknown function (DUF1707)
MNDVTTQHPDPAVRASDAEREHTVALLQHGFTDGRLTQSELEERAAAAYAARTTAELSDLTADLPTQEKPQRHGPGLDRRLLCILLCVHPPAALVYWLLTLRKQPGASTPPRPTATGRGPARGAPDHGDQLQARDRDQPAPRDAEMIRPYWRVAGQNAD